MTRLRVLYALGPGDVVGSYQHWRAGQDVLSQTSRTFSGQFFEFCERGGHSAWAISYSTPAAKLVDGSIIVENRPKPAGRHGLGYHLAQLRYALSIIASAIRWRADAVIVDSGTTHWALLAPLKPLGVKVVGSLHNVSWPKGYRPSKPFKRFLLATDAWFWRYVADAVIAVSPEGEKQVRELAPSFKGVAAQHRAQFNRKGFESLPRPAFPTGTPFRILFVGRVERSKGVLDIIDIARILEREVPGRVQFDVCGNGSAFEELSESIRQHRLDKIVRTHGQLLRPDLLKMYAATHAVIVPTRSDFCEGMPMVCAEAVLCGRPVITSPLSNSEDVLDGAIVLAKPDDARSYADCIENLLDDRARYEQLVTACVQVEEQFYDEHRSLVAALEAVFSRLQFVANGKNVDASP